MTVRQLGGAEAEVVGLDEHAGEVMVKMGSITTRAPIAGVARRRGRRRRTEERRNRGTEEQQRNRGTASQHGILVTEEQHHNTSSSRLSITTHPASSSPDINLQLKTSHIPVRFLRLSRAICSSAASRTLASSALPVRPGSFVGREERPVLRVFGVERSERVARDSRYPFPRILGPAPSSPPTTRDVQSHAPPPRRRRTAPVLRSTPPPRIVRTRPSTRPSGTRRSARTECVVRTTHARPCWPAFPSPSRPRIRPRPSRETTPAQRAVICARVASLLAVTSPPTPRIFHSASNADGDIGEGTRRSTSGIARRGIVMTTSSPSKHTTGRTSTRSNASTDIAERHRRRLLGAETFVSRDVSRSLGDDARAASGRGRRRGRGAEFHDEARRAVRESRGAAQTDMGRPDGRGGAGGGGRVGRRRRTTPKRRGRFEKTPARRATPPRDTDRSLRQRREGLRTRKEGADAGPSRARRASRVAAAAAVAPPTPDEKSPSAPAARAVPHPARRCASASGGGRRRRQEDIWRVVRDGRRGAALLAAAATRRRRFSRDTPPLSRCSRRPRREQHASSVLARPLGSGGHLAARSSAHANPAADVADAGTTRRTISGRARGFPLVAAPPPSRPAAASSARGGAKEPPTKISNASMSPRAQAPAAAAPRLWLDESMYRHATRVGGASASRSGSCTTAAAAACTNAAPPRVARRSASPSVRALTLLDRHGGAAQTRRLLRPTTEQRRAPRAWLGSGRLVHLDLAMVRPRCALSASSTSRVGVYSSVASSEVGGHRDAHHAPTALIAPRSRRGGAVPGASATAANGAYAYRRRRRRHQRRTRRTESADVGAASTPPTTPRAPPPPPPSPRDAPRDERERPLPCARR